MSFSKKKEEFYKEKGGTVKKIESVSNIITKKIQL